MSDVFFDELEIPFPRHHLGVGGGGHGEQTGRMLQALEVVLLKERPDWVLVYGDTNSTLAGTLAAVKLHIPVAHVEAGLRSFNRRMPEEINRILTDHSADKLFAPTEAAMINLRREGLGVGGMHLVGDIMYDVTLHFGEKAKARQNRLQDWGLEPRGYVLATVHRAENTDDPCRLRAIWEGFQAFYRKTGIPIVMPLHPRTRKALMAAGLKAESEGICPIDPIGFLDIVLLESKAVLIATDSGGVQKEAYFHGVPCITLRDETEWVELVEVGWNRLAPPSEGAEAIARHLNAAIDCNGSSASLYGDGKTAARILNMLS